MFQKELPHKREALLDKLYRWSWQVLSILLLASSLGSMTQGLVAWPAFAIKAFGLYRNWIRAPLAWCVDVLLPAWMWRPPLGWYDVAIIWTSTAIAIGCAQVAIGERSILHQLIQRWGRFGGLLLFVPVYIASPLMVLYNVALARGRAREMAWHVLRSMFLVYCIVGLLLFFIWQIQQ